MPTAPVGKVNPLLGMSRDQAKAYYQAKGNDVDDSAPYTPGPPPIAAADQKTLDQAGADLKTAQENERTANEFQSFNDETPTGSFTNSATGRWLAQ